MRRFIINVNGKSYDVGVEEVDAAASAPTATPAPAAAPAAPAAQPKAEAPAAPSVSASVAEGTKIEAPMPGTILEVRVSNGQAVKEGDVLFILEAMKMENEILAPVAGKVAAVSVAKGATVSAGDALCAIQ